jgi:hypothetical protein
MRTNERGDLSEIQVKVDAGGEHALLILLGADGTVRRFRTGVDGKGERDLLVGTGNPGLFDEVRRKVTPQLLQWCRPANATAAPRGELCELEVRLKRDDGKELLSRWEYGSAPAGPPPQVVEFASAAVEATNRWYEREKRSGGAKVRADWMGPILEWLKGGKDMKAMLKCGPVLTILGLLMLFVVPPQQSQSAVTTSKSVPWAPTLVRVLGEEAPAIRAQLALSLPGMSTSAQVVRGLTCALADEAPEVRRAAAQALGQLGPAAADAVADLQEHLDDEAICLDVCRALAAIRPGHAGTLAVSGTK